MPKLLSYHPSILIRGEDGELSVIRCDLQDYDTDDGVLRLLGNSFGVATAGDLVNAVKDHLYEGIRTNKFSAKSDINVVERLGEVGCSNLSLESVSGRKFSISSKAPREVGWDHLIK